MERFTLAIAFLAVTTAGWSQIERVAPDVEVPSVSVDELVRAVESENAPRVIDVRLVEDFDADPVLIPNADWRDPNKIDAWVEELFTDTPVVVYCVAGRWVSQSVTKKLIDLGFEVSQLTGGIEAWTQSGKPTLPARR